MFTFLKGVWGSGQLSMMQHVTIWAVGVLGWAPLSGRTSQSLLGLGGTTPDLRPGKGTQHQCESLREPGSQ